MRHFKTLENYLSLDMRYFFINENKQKNLRPHYISLYKKLNLVGLKFVTGNVSNLDQE